MSQSARRISALTVHLAAARTDRDREAVARRAALAEVERLRAEMVRLDARLQELEAAAAARPPARGRGLASLIPTERAI